MFEEKAFNSLTTPEERSNPMKRNLNFQELVLNEFDEKLKIYQLKVNQQSGRKCSVHALKNCLWMLEGLRGNYQNFLKSYLKTLDKNVVENYFQSLECKSLPYQDIYAQRNEIVAGKAVSVLNDQDLPKKSREYLDDIFIFVYAPVPKLDMPNHKGVSWSEFFELSKEEIIKVESLADEDLEKCAINVTILEDFEDHKIMNFFNLISKPDYNLAAYIHVADGRVGHATALVVNKVNNELEYLFLDSMHYMLHGSYPYMPMIESVQSFIENPANFKNALIRKAYVKILKYCKEYPPLRVFQMFLNIFINPGFKELNLANTQLYNEYKPYIIKLVRECMESDAENKEKYQEIISHVYYRAENYGIYAVDVSSF